MFLILIAVVSCGVERRPVKTLSDSVKLDKPVDMPVSRVVQIAPPKSKDDVRADLEKTVVRLRGSITAYKAEDDSDIHVVVESEGRTMVVEFPHPDCAGKGHVAQFAAARRALLKVLPSLPTPRVARLKVPIPIEAVGVLFFDKLHGQLGAAPNGAELHPVLTISKR